EAVANQIQHNMRGHGQFLFGECDAKPFWYYFPVLFIVKLSVPLLIGTAYVVTFGYRQLARNCALVAFALLLLFSVNCRVQLGIRMQLPALALLIVGLCAEI